MRSLLILSTVGFLLAIGGRADAAELPRIQAISGDRPALVDRSGREVILRGINVDQIGDYYQVDPRQPTTLPLGPDDFAGMRRLGFNVVRLVLSWSALEPAPGAFDQAYVDRIRTAVAQAKVEGIYVVLDMHQDAWGKFIATKPGEACPPGLGPAIGWDGAPEWATITDGLTTCRAADTRELSPATARAFDNFYLDRDGIQSALVATWGRLARAFAAESAVAGYDLLNEPHPGTVVGINEGAPLGRYYARALTAIRTAEAAAPGGFHHPAFFEPSVLWSGAGTDTLPPPAFTNDPQVVFSPHLYAESITLDRKVGLTAVSVEQGWEAAKAAGRTYRAPVWSGEWGWFGKPEDDLGRLQRYAVQEDAALAGGAWWVWRQACGDPHVAGAPGLSGSLIRYDCPGDRPLGLTVPFARVLARAHPRFAPGRLALLRSDPDTGAFEFRGERRDGQDSCRLEAWVPGDGAPLLSSEGISGLDAVREPGGWSVTGCAQGHWILRGRAVEAATGPAAPACRSRRLITVTLRTQQRPRRVSVAIGGGKARRVAARRRVPVDLRGRPAGTYMVRIEAITRDGRRLAERRTYRTCVPS